MEKTEKIISEFERFVQEYERDIGFTSYDSEVLKGVLALLKAQEPVKPVFDMGTWRCGNCGHVVQHQLSFGDNVLLFERYGYCLMCGKQVKWGA